LLLSILNYLYDNLTNFNLVKNYLNEVHKALFELNFNECKKLLEVNKEIKTCKYNISKLTSALKDKEVAHKNYYEDDNKNKEKEEKKENDVNKS